MGTPASIPVPEPEVALCRVLTRHHLLNRTETGSGSLVDVADDVVGLHATIPATPYLSLHERIRHFDSTDLDDALYGRRSLVRLKAMRGTVFVVSRRLAPVVFAATRAATTASDRRWLGTNEQAYARLTPKVLAALAGRSLTVRELRKTIGADADLSGIVAMLCDEGRIVRDRPVGSRHSSTFRYRLWTDAFPGVRLDEWDEDTATQELVRLYLDSYGPASRADLIWWTGLPARRIDEAIDRLGAVLTTVSVTGLGNRLLMTQTALHDTKTTDPTTSAVQLLPKLDPYTMADREPRRVTRRHSTMRTRRLLLLLVLTSLAAGCGTQRGPDSARPSPPESSQQLRADERDAVDALAQGPAGDPSDFKWGDQIFHFLTEEGRVIDEQPWTACLSNGCWDGGPGLGGPIPSVGSPDALYFAFDYPGWTFHWVSFNPVDDECGGRNITVRATPVTGRIFRVDPAGLRGEWRVDVFGRAPAGGDAVTSVRWTTPDDGSMPEPRATGSLFTDQDGKRVAPSGGPELHLNDLARTPASAAASWTVTDRTGTSVTIPLRRKESRCERDGAVSFQGRELTPAELDSLSGPSVTYTVEVSLDGKTYTGTAQWPQDETAEAPYTRFTFEPSLPAYRG